MILSAAIMPESTYYNKYYYGQDVNYLSQYLDVICPMVYKGNYKKSSSWIKSATNNIVKASSHAQIWTGLQTYKSDYNLAKLSKSDLSKDCKNALAGGASGIVLFRYGLTNFINFKSLYPGYKPPVAKVVSVSDIIKAASSFKSYMDSHKKIMPHSIKVGNHSVSSSKFSYLMSCAILKIKDNKKSSMIIIKNINSNKHVVYKIHKLVSKSNYIKVTFNINRFMSSKGIVPAYAAIGNKKANFKTYTYAFSKILNYYNSKKYLSSYCAFFS